MLPALSGKHPKSRRLPTCPHQRAAWHDQSCWWTASRVGALPDFSPVYVAKWGPVEVKGQSFLLHLLIGMNNHSLSRVKNNQAQSLSNLFLWTETYSCRDSRKATVCPVALKEDALNSSSSTSIIASWIWNSQMSSVILFTAIICLY